MYIRENVFEHRLKYITFIVIDKNVDGLRVPTLSFHKIVL